MAPAASSHSAAEAMHLCCVCGQSFGIDGITKVQNPDSICSDKTNAQIRCKGCNALKSRISRIMKSAGDELIGYHNFSQDERKEFYKKAQLMCGAHLQKLLTETVTTVNIRRMSDTLTTQGNFLPVDEVVTEWNKTKPIMLQNLLANAPRMTCSTTKAELIFVPTYTMKIEKVNIQEDTRKRKLESETRIQKVKAIKKEPAADQMDGPTVAPRDAPKTLSEQQVKRLHVAIGKCETHKMTYAATMVEAQAPEMTEHVPPAVVTNFKNTLGLVDELIATATDMASTRKATSADFKRIFPELKHNLDTAKALNTTLRTCVDNAAAWGGA